MHALIIEDEPIIALLIEEHLRGLGFLTFAFAGSEAGAIEAASERCPDLITADVRLAQGCGIAAVESICSGRPIPVVFITATSWEVRERLCDAILVEKPFAPAELNHALVTAVAGTQPAT